MKELNLFETIKAAVPVRTAASFCGLKVERGGMVRCPFHNDKTPSMKLNDTYYYCFGCHAHGDAVALTAQVMHLTPREAALRLAEAFHVDVSQPQPLQRPREPRKPDVAARKQELEAVRRRAWVDQAENVLVRYVMLLAEWKEMYAPDPDGNGDIHPRYKEACMKEDKAFELLQMAVDPLRQAELYEHDKEEIQNIYDKIRAYDAGERNDHQPAGGSPEHREADAGNN